jgi:hypothetical protein
MEYTAVAAAAECQSVSATNLSAGELLLLQNNKTADRIRAILVLHTFGSHTSFTTTLNAATMLLVYSFKAYIIVEVDDSCQWFAARSIDQQAAGRLLPPINLFIILSICI